MSSLISPFARRSADGSPVAICDYCFFFDDPDPIALGREVARAELAILTHELESAAKTLDYWQSHRQDGWYQQRAWAEVRRKSKQAVGDNVRAAREHIDE
jgi:signal recognition particle subunit SEC65